MLSIGLDTTDESDFRYRIQTKVVLHSVEIENPHISNKIMCDFLVHRTHLYKPRLSSILSLSHHQHNSSPNHLLAVLRSDHSIELWNSHDSFTLERTIQPRNASHSPELILWLDKYLITAGLDGQLIAYDPITYDILTSCHAAGGAIWSIAKHETTRRIAVGTETGHVNIYQLDEVKFSLFKFF